MNTRKAVIQGNDTVLTAVQDDRAKKAARTEDEPNYTEFTVERDRMRTLRFHGLLLGRGAQERTDDSGVRGTEVTIYVTHADRYVTEVRQWEDSKKRTRSRHDAEAHDSPEEAIAWLTKDAGGRMRGASTEAWLQACEAFDPLKKYAIEEV